MKRKPKKKRTLPTKYVLLVLTIVCIVLIFASFIFNVSVGPLNTMAGYVFIPMQRGINIVGAAISEKIDYLENVTTVMEENEKLKVQVDELTEELNSLKLDQYELEKLQELLEVDEEYSEYDKVTARVVGKDAGNWFSVFLIDKGSKDGITENMNVLGPGGGLAGIVIEVGANYAKVRAIIDDTNNVSAQVVNTSDRCIISGSLLKMNEEQTIELSNLQDEEDKVEVGDQLVTSNISDKYLPGLRIGYISTLEYDANNLTKSGSVTPAVDFKHLDMVLVITETKNYGETAE